MSEFTTAEAAAIKMAVDAPARVASHPVPPTPAIAALSSDSETTEMLPVVEETLSVSKRMIAAGKVRVSTRTETYVETAEIALQRHVSDVSRVPIGRLVETAPLVRTEGDITIVPVLEERFVVVKQLYLTEELHIRNRLVSEVSRTPVQLRRQVAVVEHLDANGRAILDEAALEIPGHTSAV